MTNPIEQILSEIIHAFDNEDAPLDILLALDDHVSHVINISDREASVYLEADQYYKVTVEAVGPYLP